jgi:hypothetical protein
MQKYIIKGNISESNKDLKFTDIVPIVKGENAITELQITLTDAFLEQTIEAFLLMKYESGETTITSLLNESNVLKYTFKNTSLTETGTLYIAVLINKAVGDEIETFKTITNKQLYVVRSLSENDAITPKTQENLLSDIQNAIDTANAVSNQLLLDKEVGLFNGDKGDKGNPSTIDKIGTAQTAIDLTDIENGIYGTIDNPIIINDTATITFNNLSLDSGYQKSFILYIKRTADVSITWQNITKWAYDEIPILTVNKVQKILIETSDGTNYYGTQGDYFNV